MGNETNRSMTRLGNVSKLNLVHTNTTPDEPFKIVVDNYRSNVEKFKQKQN